MSVDSHTFPNLDDFARGVDQIGRTLDAHRLFAIQVLLPVRAVFLAHGVVFIDQQRERQFKLVTKFDVTFGGIGADAKQLCPRGLQLCVSIAERTGLFSASRCIVFGIEKQNDRSASQIFQFDGLAVLVFEREGGSLFAWFDEISHDETPHLGAYGLKGGGWDRALFSIGQVVASGGGLTETRDWIRRGKTRQKHASGWCLTGAPKKQTRYTTGQLRDVGLLHPPFFPHSLESCLNLSDQPPSSSNDTPSADPMAHPSRAIRPHGLEDARKLATEAARVALDNNGQDVMVLNVSEQSAEFDFFVIATGTSRRQLHAISEQTDDALEKGLGDRRQGIEGYQESSWIVLDYGSLVVHLFDEETREYYDLESLWADATPIPLSDLGLTQR